MQDSTQVLDGGRAKRNCPKGSHRLSKAKRRSLGMKKRHATCYSNATGESIGHRAHSARKHMKMGGGGDDVEPLAGGETADAVEGGYKHGRRGRGMRGSMFGFRGGAALTGGSDAQVPQLSGGNVSEVMNIVGGMVESGLVQGGPLLGGRRHKRAHWYGGAAEVAEPASLSGGRRRRRMYGGSEETAAPLAGGSDDTTTSVSGGRRHRRRY